MANPKPLALPNPLVPFIDVKTGLIDPNWYKVLLSLDDRTKSETLKFSSIEVGAPTGGNLGAGSINAETIYEQNKRVFAQGGDASGGVTFTPHDHGTVSSGTITPNPSSGLKQVVTNDGAFTIAATSEVGDVELRVVNASSAGAITFSGFDKQWVGDSLDTTDAHQFVVFVYGFSGKQAYLIKALQ
jgi:hypothetical protein